MPHPVVLKRLDAAGEYACAVELQQLTWGASFRDVVPAAVLKVAQRVGGVTAGAFGPNGEMLGFVFGLAGHCDGRLMHWSHMLAVRPDHRDHGIGQQLKAYQRELLLASGCEWIYWTVDPLVARNAHLNLNRLRAEVREYVPDMYGDTGSKLHVSGTDRFVLAWPVSRASTAGHCGKVDSASSPWQPERSNDSPVMFDGPILNDLDERVTVELLSGGSRPCVVRIEIPYDIEVVKLAEARFWRLATRRAFLTAFRSGYEITGFQAAAGRCFYALSPLQVSH